MEEGCYGDKVCGGGGGEERKGCRGKSKVAGVIWCVEGEEVRKERGGGGEERLVEGNEGCCYSHSPPPPPVPNSPSPP